MQCWRTYCVRSIRAVSGVVAALDFTPRRTAQLPRSRRRRAVTRTPPRFRFLPLPLLLDDGPLFLLLLLPLPPEVGVGVAGRPAASGEPSRALLRTPRHEGKRRCRRGPSRNRYRRRRRAAAGRACRRSRRPTTPAPLPCPPPAAEHVPHHAPPAARPAAGGVARRRAAVAERLGWCRPSHARHASAATPRRAERDGGHGRTAKGPAGCIQRTIHSCLLYYNEIGGC
jgi:hypothetical protein